MSSLSGSMAPSIIVNDVFQGETFLPGQIFVFGSFALRASQLSSPAQKRVMSVGVKTSGPRLGGPELCV